MKHILFIAPHSFPIKSSESICNSKVAFTLANVGYKVDVFTCSNSSTYPVDQRIDDYLKSNPNISVKTVKYGSSYFSRTAPLSKNLKSLLPNLLIFLQTGYFYNGIYIAYAILKAVKQTIKCYGKMPYDVVVTRGFNTDIVGIYLKKKYGLKWIANWNDPFPGAKFPAPYGQGYDAKLPFFENIVYNDIQKYADIHTFPSERLRNYMLKCFKKVKIEQTYVIHHMAHSGLTQYFAGSKKVDGVLKLVSCGSVGKPRKPEVFLNALAISLHRFPGISVKCYFVGYYDEKLQNLVEELDLKEVVEFIPPKNYSECMAFISSCDVSLVIETSCEEGIYLPTKVVDAVQCELPIFCVSPNVGTLRDIVNEFGIGYASDIDDQGDVSEKIDQLLNDYVKGKLPKCNKQLAPVFFEDYIGIQYKTLIGK